MSSPNISLILLPSKFSSNFPESVSCFLSFVAFKVKVHLLNSSISCWHINPSQKTLTLKEQQKTLNIPFLSLNFLTIASLSSKPRFSMSSISSSPGFLVPCLTTHQTDETLQPRPKSKAFLKVYNWRNYHLSTKRLFLWWIHRLCILFWLKSTTFRRSN